MAIRRERSTGVVMEESVVGDDDGGPHLDAVVHMDHIVVEHPDAAEADGSTQFHPVGPCRAVDGVLTGSNLHISHIAHANGVVGARGNHFPLLVIHRLRVHFGHRIGARRRGRFRCSDGHRYRRSSEGLRTRP